MIAADTSTWTAFLQGDGGEDTDLLDRALRDRQVLMPPAVLAEVLSDPTLPALMLRSGPHRAEPGGLHLTSPAIAWQGVIKTALAIDSSRDPAEPATTIRGSAPGGGCNLAMIVNVPR